MRWHFVWEPDETQLPWFVGGLFNVAGLVCLAVAIHVFRSHGIGGKASWAGSLSDPSFVTFALLALLLMGLGSAILLLGMWGCRVRSTTPWNHAPWSWWMRTLSGSLGALMFAIPATAALPVLYLAVRSGAHPLLAEANVGPVGLLLLGGLFSMLGLLTLALLWWVVSNTFPSRPRWRSAGPPGHGPR